MLKALVMFVIAMFLAALIGISLGMLGGGGSILTLPILKYVLGFEAHQAIAASLFVVGATSATALIPHARKGRVRWRTGIIFGLAGMAGAFAAGRVAKFIPAGILLVLFAVMMVVTAIMMLRGRKAAAGAATDAVSGDLPVAKVVVEGLVVGGVTGLVGAGGGFLVVPALVLLGGLPMSVAVGTSLLVISMKSFAGFAGYLSSTTVDWKTLLAVTGVAILGSVVGGWAAGRVPQEKLRRGFGWFVVVMAVFMLAQELPALFHVKLAPSIPVLLAGVTTILVVLAEAISSRHSARAAHIVPAE